MPEDSSAGPSAPRPRTLVLAILAVTVALAAIAVVAALVFPPDGSAPGAEPTAPQSPASPVSGDIPLSPGEAEDAGSLSERNAESVISAAFNVKTTDTEDADALRKKLAGVVEGSYLAELEAQQQELQVNGWEIRGKAKVVSTVIDEITEKKGVARARVTSCIDTSKTETLDFGGNAMPKPAGANRALHIFTLQQNADGTWAVIRHTFPDNPKC